MRNWQPVIDALNGISDPSPALAQWIAQSVAHFQIISIEDFAAWEARIDAMQAAWFALTPDERVQVNRLLEAVRS